MKRSLSFILSLVMVIGIITSVPVTVSAANESDLEFSFDSERKGYWVVGCDASAEGKLDIPDTYNNKPVVGIDSNVFEGCAKITSITIPKSVTELSFYAFDKCSGLESIIVNENNTQYSSVEGVLFNKRKTVLLKYPDGKASSNYIMPESVIEIPYYAFDKCTKLKSITLPKSLKSMYPGAFMWCSNLTSIIVDDNNNYYASVSGVLFDKSKTTLLQYPLGNSAKEYTVPAGVTSIAEQAFCGCVALESITFPKGLISIGYYSFRDCTSLKAISIPEGTQSIESEAFYGCLNLASVSLPDSLTYIGADILNFTAYYSNSDNWEKKALDLYIGKHLVSINDYQLYGSYTVKEGTKTIAAGAFGYCENMTSVIIPDSVENIGSSAFSNCTSLTSIEIPSSVECIEGNTFYGCTSLKSVTIPSSVKFIGDGAFECCTGLESITISEGVERIEQFAFQDCEALASITVPDSVSYIGYAAFRNTACLNNGSNRDNGVLYLGKHLVDANPDVLKGSYTVKKGTKTIVDSAVGDCDGLTSLTIPGSVTDIGVAAFESCSNLKSVKLSNGVKNIGVSAFTSCNDLETVKIPASVESIGLNAFRWCSSLQSIEIDENNKHYSFVDGVLFNKDKTTLILHLECNYNQEYIVPDSVTNIVENAFYSAHYLESITIPGSVKTIGKNAFEHCYNMTSLKIGDGVKFIDENAFLGCDSLTSVTIPESVTDIGECAFGYDNGFSVSAMADFTIYGVKGSEAEAYAKANGFTFKIACTHASTKWVTDEEATCTEEGSKHKECTVCNEVLETKVIEKKEHTVSDWIISKAATVYKAGEKHKECTVCGEVLKTATIKQLKCSQPVLKKVYNANDYVKVAWGTVKGADLYRVYRKTGTGSYEYIGSTKNTYFNDKEAGAGKTCRYRIKAKNEAGYSEYSATLAVKHIDEPTLKSIENSAYGVLIKWNKVTGAQKYSVYRKVSGGEYEYLGATTNAYYTDKTAKSGKKYYYAIRGKRDDSVSSQSASLSKYYLEDPTLKTPTSVKSGVNLTWSKVTGAEGYVVYRKTGSGSYSKLVTVKGSAKVTYTDKSAKKGTKYYYKVKAYKSKTYSAYSNTKSITDKY